MTAGSEFAATPRVESSTSASARRGEAAHSRVDLALVAFIFVEIGAFVFYVLAGRMKWFYGDEWFYLAGRRANLSDLLQPYEGHWGALPLLVFRTLYRTVGLRSYVPYQCVSIALHGCAGWMLRAIMRRAGANDWISTVTAALFVLFGTGSQDTLGAFQMMFDGALVLGLGQLLLADHRLSARRIRIERRVHHDHMAAIA